MFIMNIIIVTRRIGRRGDREGVRQNVTPSCKTDFVNTRGRRGGRQKNARLCSLASLLTAPFSRTPVFCGRCTARERERDRARETETETETEIETERETERERETPTGCTAAGVGLSVLLPVVSKMCDFVMLERVLPVLLPRGGGPMQESTRRFSRGAPDSYGKNPRTENSFVKMLEGIPLFCRLLPLEKRIGSVRTQ